MPEPVECHVADGAIPRRFLTSNFHSGGVILINMWWRDLKIAGLGIKWR
jgi:hypothetical protein